MRLLRLECRSQVWLPLNLNSPLLSQEKFFSSADAVYRTGGHAARLGEFAELTNARSRVLYTTVNL